MVSETFSLSGVSRVEAPNTPSQGASPQAAGSIFGRILGSAASLAGNIIHGATGRFFSHYKQKLDKESHIKEAQSEILEAVGDPQLLEGANLVSKILGERVETKFEGVSDGILKQEVLKQKGLIQDLIEINLMKGFANLAKQLEANKDSIPRYDSQTALVNLIAYLAQKLQIPGAVKKLEKISPLYAEIQLRHTDLLERLFPDREQLEIKQAIQTVVDACQEDNAFFEADRLFESRFANAKDCLKFLDYCQEESARQRQMDEIFMPIVEEILKLLFNERLDGIVLPYFSTVLGTKSVQSYLLDAIREALSELFRESHDSMQKSLAHRAEWEEKIRSCNPDADIPGWIKTPTEILVKGIQNYIRTNPEAVALVEDGLEALFLDNPDKTFTELAGWILRSLQSLFHTKDPQLLETGSALSPLLENLTLALIAKGLEASIKEDIAPDQYLNFLIAQFISQVNRIRNGEMIPDLVWKEIVKDLPLPDGIKPFVLKHIIAKAQNAQEALMQRGIYTERIVAYYTEAMEEVRKCEGADQLIMISSGVTDLLIHEVVTETIQATQLGEKYVELLDEYLPGIAVNEDVKVFLKNNLHALTLNLGSEEAPEAIELLKRGIQAAILKSIVRAVGLNIDDPKGNYAAQISKQLRDAFSYSFQHFTEEQKEDLFIATALQKEAQAIKSQIDGLQRMIHGKPEGLTEEQSKFLDNLFASKKRLIKNAHQILLLSYRQRDLKQKIEDSPQDADLDQWKKAERQINQTILQAKLEQTHYSYAFKENLCLVKEAALSHESFEWVHQTLSALDRVHQFTQESEALDAQLSEKICPFKNLSTQILALLGLDQKEHLQVPDFMKDHVWPLIEGAKEKVIAKLLFEQLSPLLPSVFNREANRRIIQRSSNSDLWQSIAKVVSEEIVAKLSHFVTDTEKIAKEVSNRIPGGKGLHKLLEPELKKVIHSDEPIFVENRQFLQQYIEGIILLYIVKVIQANENQDILELLKTKIANSPIEKGADAILDEIVMEVLNVQSEDDLLNVPPALKKMVYKEIKEQTHSLLGPVLTPILERKTNLAKLEEQSGSSLFGRLSQTMAKDLFTLLPKVLSPKALAAAIQAEAPSVTPEIEIHLADGFEQLLHGESSTLYEQLSTLGEPYLEGVLICLFQTIAEKHPPKDGKDSLLLLSDKLLETLRGRYKQGITEDPQALADELSEEILQDLLGIGADLPGLPPPLQPIVLDFVKRRLAQFIRHVYEIGQENRNTEKTVDALRTFGVDPKTGQPLAQILARDVAQAVIESTPFILDDPKGNSTIGLDLISNTAREKLEAYSAEGLETAEALLHYPNIGAAKEMLGSLIHEAAKEDQFIEEKQSSTEFLSNLLLAPLNTLFSKVTEFESGNGKEQTHKLMADLLHVGAEHLKALNAATDADGKISHASFVSEMGDALHPAVPKTESEKKVIDRQRSETFYKQASINALKLLFPNDDKDLTFIPEELREKVWEMIKVSLFPSMLQIGVEAFLNPVNVSKLMVNLLKTSRDSLNGEIVEVEKMEADPDLVKAMGEFLEPLLENVELPERIKRQLFTPEGKLLDSMVQKLGLALTRQLTDTFIRDNFALFLRKAAERDPATGDHMVQFTKVHAEERDAYDRVQMDRLGKELKIASREVVDAGISNFIRSYYFQFKQASDRIVQSAFGESGLRIKHALGLVFEFIFCKIIGTLLSYLFWPATFLAKRGIYHYLSLDQNRDVIMNRLIQLPADQPERAETRHPMIHEDLIYKLFCKL